MKAYSYRRGIQHVEEPYYFCFDEQAHPQDYKHARSDRQMFFGVLYRVEESECRLQLTPEGQKKLRSKVNILTFGQLTVDAQLNLVIMTTSPRTRKTGVSLPLKEQTLK